MLHHLHTCAPKQGSSSLCYTAELICLSKCNLQDAPQAMKVMPHHQQSRAKGGLCDAEDGGSRRNTAMQASDLSCK